MLPIGHKFITDIVSKSLYLHERINGVCYCDDGYVNERMNYWKTKVGEDLFKQRLTAETLSIEKARMLCHKVSYLNTELPSWTKIWCNVLEFSYNDMMMFQLETTDYFISPPYPVWIRECVYTYVLYAFREIQKEHLEENLSVIKDMFSDLWNQLCKIASSALTEFIFNIPIAQKQSISLQFYEQQEQFYMTYPVAARLLSECVETWLIHTPQVLDRVRKDFSEYPSKLITISAGLSDYHAGGQTSHKICFEDGSCYMYKPHSLNTDTAWKSFCEQLLSVTGKRIDFVPVIECEGYGYCQWIDYDTPHDIPLFFENCGSLLCIMYLLHTTDMHYENVIANKHQLYIIDTETITTSDDMVDVSATSMLNVKMPHSKISEIFCNDKDIERDDIGGLTSTIVAQNLPVIQDIPITARSYSNSVCTGFAEMYDSLMACDCSSLERHFDHCKLRYVFRPTRVYSQLLSVMNSAENLKDGFFYSCEVERLIKGCDIKKFAIYQSERNALLKQDIPIFYQKANESSLYDHKEMILKEYFNHKISQQNLFSHLNLEDEKKQLMKIKQQLKDNN